MNRPFVDTFYQDENDPQFEKKVHEGAEFELSRFKIAERFPALDQLAEVHKKANMFGIRRQNENRVCPCCSERMKQTKFSACSTDMDNPILSSDIVLLFAFIRMLIYYFLLRFAVTDTYNLITNYLGQDCTPQIFCRSSFTQRFTTVNKMTNKNELEIVDLLNLVFVVLSIIFFSAYNRYLYRWFIQMSIRISTQDDFTLFLTNIPIIQEINKSNEIHYAEGIKAYFDQMITDWLNNPTDNTEIYNDYMIVSSTIHSHHPQHPPAIISKVNLCWNLYDLNEVNEKKENIQKYYQKNMEDNQENKTEKKDKQPKKDKDIIFDQKQCLESIKLLDKTGIDLCQQFQLNQYYGFVMPKFLGKAFVSFEYEHFARVALDRIPKAQAFGNHYLRAKFAAPPRDIYWQNLHVSKWSKFEKLLITFFVCTILLLITFFILLIVKYQQRKFYKDLELNASFSKKLFIRLSVSLFTIGINTLLRMAIKRLAKFEQHDTKSHENLAIMYKSIIAIICNQIVNPLIVNLLLGNLLWRSNGIISQITNLLTTSILLNIFRYIVNPRTIWAWIKFKWTYRNSPPILKFQNDYNAEYAHQNFEVYQKYLFYTNELFLISFFAYLVPFGSIMGVGFYLARYTIDRIMLLKWSSFHPRFSYHLTQRSLILVETSVLIFALGNYVNKWLYFGIWIQKINLISLLIAIIYTVLIWIQSIQKIFFKQNIQYQKKSYSQSANKHNFFHTYYKLNPATKLASYSKQDVKYIGVNYPIPQFIH